MNEDTNVEINLQYPIDPFMDKISLFADKIFKEWIEQGVIFEIDGEIMDNVRETIMLSKPDMLLPLIIIDADNTHKEMISGGRLPFYLYKDEGSLVEYCPAAYDHLEENTMSLWTHHIDYSIEKLIEKSEPNYKKKLGKDKIVVSLNEIHENFKIALENKTVELKNYPNYHSPDMGHRSIF